MNASLNQWLVSFSAWLRKMRRGLFGVNGEDMRPRRRPNCRVGPTLGAQIPDGRGPVVGPEPYLRNRSDVVDTDRAQKGVVGLELGICLGRVLLLCRGFQRLGDIPEPAESITGGAAANTMGHA